MSRHTLYGLALVVCIPILNIALNTAAKSVGSPDRTLVSALISWKFALAFCIGSTSLVLLVALYRTGIPLGRAILLMGAMSILGGAAWGYLFHRVAPTPIEVALLVAIGALLFVRLYQLASTVG
jgi:hypothetical protein